MRTIEKTLKIINTDLDRDTTPIEILALKGAKSLEVGLNLMIANRGLIMDFDIPKHKVIDWSKVPIDTPIFVRDSKLQKWRPRHFCDFRGGQIYAYADGTTSHSAEGKAFPWEYAKLANAEFADEDV